MTQLPAISCAFGKNEKIIVVTANSETLKPMYRLVERECGIDFENNNGGKFIIIGAQDVDGFGAVAAGDAVDVDKVTPGMIKLC